ncbi:MAG: cell envelope integrity protein TolA, partial [Parvibaculales bacterium]
IPITETPPIKEVKREEKQSSEAVLEKASVPPLAEAVLAPSSAPKLVEEVLPAVVSQPSFLPVPRPKHSDRFINRGELAALLNKIPEEEVPEEKVPPKGSSLLTRLTLSEIDGLKVQMRRCWSVPSGAAEAEKLTVRVKMALNPDGSLASAPVLVNRSRLNEPYFRIAAESALRAIRRCQPFSMPLDKYANWQEVELTFDPSDMIE